MSTATSGQLQALLDGPGLKPPPGVVPNFVDPPNLHPIGTVTILLSLIFSTLAVAMRIFTKIRYMKSLVTVDCGFYILLLFLY